MDLKILAEAYLKIINQATEELTKIPWWRFFKKEKIKAKRRWALHYYNNT